LALLKRNSDNPRRRARKKTAEGGMRVAFVEAGEGCLKNHGPRTKRGTSDKGEGYTAQRGRVGPITGGKIQEFLV